jgi:hypothetical protein
MKTMHTITLSTTLFASILASTTVQAGIIVPAGLNPGDQYYLAFVTDGVTTPLSSVIGDYNNFVQGEAALDPALTGTGIGVSWRAVVSYGLLSNPSHVTAITNLGLTPGIPVYLLDGTTKVSVVDGTGWLGSSLLAPIDEDQFAALHAASDVITGTSTTGGPSAFPVGVGPGSSITVGNETLSSSGWVFSATVSSGVGNNNSFSEPHDPLYAVSTLQTVVPEPASSWLLLIGGGVLGAAAWRRRKVG